MAEKYVPVFYDWIEATQELNDQEKGRLIDAVVLYARGGDWQDRIKGNERYAFPVFRLQIDRAKEISATRADARKNKTEQNEQNGTKPITITNTRTKTRTNTNTTTNTKGDEKRAVRFTPPTIEDVQAYAGEKGWAEQQFSPQRFVDFYASKGWKVGKEPMKDWKAAARGWVSRQDDAPWGRTQLDRRPQDNPALNYTQREYTQEEDEDLYLDLDYFAKTGESKTIGQVKRMRERGEIE